MEEQPGPTTYRELVGAHQGFVTRALRLIDNAETTIKGNINGDGSQLKIILSTDYSGMGSFEMAGDLVVDRLQDVLSLPELPLCVACHRAADFDGECRKVLMSHTGPFAPKHVQADILNRLDGKTLDRLHAILKKHKARAARRSASSKSKSKQDIKVKQGKIFMEEAAALMRTVRFKKKSYCYVHRDKCDVHPTEEERQGAMYVVAGGNTCVAWSRMGARDGWLHESSIVLLV